MKAPSSSMVLSALETLRTFLQAPLASSNPMAESRAFYTSRGPLPPGVSRRRFNEIARELPAARKDGRVWVVPVPAWTQYRSVASRPLQAIRSPQPWTPERALEQAGLRLVGGDQ